ncbi:MAG: ArsA family ATPase [Nitrospirae bacterium]|nr:ArsA family ATPase [Nitrospirota bacterium]
MGRPCRPVRTIFFIGKGGVGKTTSSASLACHLAGKGKKVYWVSIDPAHNLCDIAGCRPFKGPKEIAKNLLAEEIDTDRCTEAYIKTNINRMKETYRYLGIINLENAFDILRYSPGMEEAAIMYALIEGIRKYQDRVDYIIVDTPPTGLMLRIFALPFTSTLWIEKLSDWREAILGRRKTVNSIRGEDSPYRDLEMEKEDDPVLKELGIQMERVSFLKSIFTESSKSSVILVMNQDRLAFKESVRIRDALSRLGISISLVLLNKFKMMDETGGHIMEAFKGSVVVKQPFIEGHISRELLVGMAAQWAERVMQAE